MKLSCVMKKESSIKVEVKQGIILPDRFIQENDDACLGFDFWYSRIGSGLTVATLTAEPHTIIASDGAGQVAYIPCFKRKIFPGITFMCGYPYVRIFGDDKLFLDNMDLVINTCFQQQITRIELIVSGRDLQLVDDLTTFAHPAITIQNEVRFTRQIVNIQHLSGASDFVSAYPSKIRWSINKAAKENVVYSTLNDTSALPAHELYMEVLREKGAPVYYGPNRLQYIIDNLTPGKQGFIYLARIGSDAVGMAAVVYAGKTAHLLQVAVPRHYAKYRVSDSLVAYAQYEAAKAGKVYFDFMATPEFEPGVKEYKAKWGGETEPVETVIITIKKYRSCLIDVLRYLSRKFPGLVVRRN